MIQLPLSPPDAASCKAILEDAAARYNHPGFIEHDPISAPHRFSKIAGSGNYRILGGDAGLGATQNDFCKAQLP